MALTASAVAEVWSNGSDNNAGFFDPGVAGFPTDGTVDSNTGNTAAPVFSSASYNFVAGDVNAWIYIKSGTNSLPGWYKIVSVASNKATLNATIGAAVLAAGTPTTVVGLATVGTPTSLTWGIDYSQSASARIAFTDMTILGTNTQFTSAANPVGKNFIGNIINVTSGVGFTVQRVAIISTSGTTATCDKAIGTALSVNGTGNLGGAFLSPALPFSVVVSNNTVWIKSGAYTISSSSSNVANGVIALAVNSTIRLEGYGTVRGDLLSAPVLTASGISSVTLISSSGSASDWAVRNITVDGASLSAIRGFVLQRCNGYLLTANNCTNSGFTSSTTVSTLTRCVATGCSTQPAFLNIHCFFCEAYNGTVTGFSMTSTYASLCLSYNNSGASSDGFVLGLPGYAISCIAYNNGRDGFRFNSLDDTTINCIAEANSGIGFNGVNGVGIMLNCAAYLNGTNFILSGSFLLALNNITLTASAFVNAAAGNFALNASAGGGALLRAVAIPGVTPDGLSKGYLDVGAIQSKALATLGVGFGGGLVT